MTQLTSESDRSQQKSVQSLVEEWTAKYEWLKNFNMGLGLSLGISGILLSFGATLAGIVGTAEAAKVAACLAPASATVQSALLAYPVDKRARFYRILAAKNMNLSTDLKFNQYTDQQLKEILEEFKSIQLEAATREPQNDVRKTPEDAQPGEAVAEEKDVSKERSQPPEKVEKQRSFDPKIAS
jgi:hypothetical protein